MALAAWNFHVQDSAGNDVATASIEVRRESDNALASIYSDRAGTVALGNPYFPGAATGRFHVVGGAYKITATFGTSSVIWRYVAIGLAAEGDVATGGGGGGTPGGINKEVQFNDGGVFAGSNGFAWDKISTQGGDAHNAKPGRLGIGTNNPGAQIEISNDGDQPAAPNNWYQLGGAGLLITGSRDNSASFGCQVIGNPPVGGGNDQTLIEWGWYRSRGVTNTSNGGITPQPLLRGDTIGQWQYLGRPAAGHPFGNFGFGGAFSVRTAADWTASSTPMFMQWSTTPPGATLPHLSFLLSALGGITVGIPTPDPVVPPYTSALPVDPGYGIVNAMIGFKVADAAAAGTVLRGDGTKFVPATLTGTDVGVRRVITAADVTAGEFNVYVNGTTGNDGNPGTSASPFQTIQRGVDYVCGSIDAQFYNVTVNVANGTYTSTVQLKPFIGAGTFKLKGNTASPASCLISVSLSNCIAAGGAGCVWTVEGFKLQTSAGGTACMAVQAQAQIQFGVMDFGATNGGNPHLSVSSGGILLPMGPNYTISGDAGGHMSLDSGAQVAVGTFINVDMPGLRSLGTFVSASALALGQMFGLIFRRTDQANKVRRTATANTTVGSNSISSIAIAGTDTSALFVGMHVLCRDGSNNLIFPIGTTITVINNANTVTVSNNAASTQTGIAVGFEIAIAKKFNASLNSVVTSGTAVPGNDFGTAATGGQFT